jgi:hypothetical protein
MDEDDGASSSAFFQNGSSFGFTAPAVDVGADVDHEDRIFDRVSSCSTAKGGCTETLPKPTNDPYAR